jgi:hypothetical protein
MINICLIYINSNIYFIEFRFCTYLIIIVIIIINALVFSVLLVSFY